MNRRPTIKDVAKAAEVSIGTVSKDINNDPTVRLATRKAVQALIAELGYRPRALARSFQSGKSRAIGFVVGDLSNESSLSAIPLAQEQARRRGYTLIVADSRLNRETEVENINMMMDLRVEGLLWRPVFPFDPENVPAFPEVPTVTFTLIKQPFTCVYGDTREALRSAADDLAKHQHRSAAIALLSGASSLTLVDGITTRMAAVGISVEPEFVKVYASRDDARTEMADALRRPEHPRAVLVGSAILSSALLAAEDAGLRIGKDLSIISIADSQLAQTFIPHINTVSFDRAVEAELGIDALFELLSDQSTQPKSIAYAVQYVRRQSIGTARYPQPLSS